MFRCVQTTNKKKEMSVFVRHVWSSSSPHLWDLAGGRNLSSSFATGIVVIVVHVPVTQHHTTQLVVTNCTLLNTTTKSHRTSRSKTWSYHKTTNTWTNNRRRNLSICIINLFTFIRHRLVFDLTIVAISVAISAVIHWLQASFGDVTFLFIARRSSVLHISRLWSLDYRRHSGTLRPYLLRGVKLVTLGFGVGARVCLYVTNNAMASVAI